MGHIGNEVEVSMATSEQDVQAEGQYVHANGIDIYYVEAGQWDPLRLHGGVVSTSPVHRALLRGS
jgi:hypothetical protein